MRKAVWIAALVVGCAVGRLSAQEGAPKVEVRAIAEIARANRVDPATGRAITTVGSGAHCTVTVWQFTKGIAPHIHREHDEVIYCEQGEGLARIGDRTVKMRPGDFVVIPPGVPHGVTVTGKGVMRGISVFSPAFDGTDRFPAP